MKESTNKQSKETTFELRDVDDLIPYARNARTHSPEQVQKLAGSIKEFGFLNPVVISDDGGILAGHGRVLAAQKLGIKQVPCVVESHLTEAQKRAYILADNRLALDAGWDDEMLKIELSELKDMDFDLDLVGFDGVEIDEIFNGSTIIDQTGEEDNKYSIREYIKNHPDFLTLRQRFFVPPFSILDTTNKDWQNRKKQYLDLGIVSDIGRDKELLCFNKNITASSNDSGTSSFDPVLCEILISWFCPKDGTIVDPFAGGPTRGIVSAITGKKYFGIDLRKEQISANQEVSDKFQDIPKPNWIVGDSSNIDDLCKGIEADFILSCPPYADLEKYSEDPKDLSNMDYPEFRKAYFNIIAKTSNLLKENRFAAFVVSEVRDKNGFYYGFVKDTIDAFLKAGLTFYNEIILKNCFGSLPVRCVKPFVSTRKVGKTHQNVLIFVKGDPVKATEACGTVEIDEDLLNSICED